MGSLAKSSSLQTYKMMKSIAVAALCLFAVVAGEAEADASAEAGYHYGHYGYGHHGYHGLHQGYYGYPYAHHGYHYAYGHHYGKRSADAEPEASADAGYHYGHY